jgi:hypothetical protein
MTFTDAFATYSAKLHNPMWSISTFGPDGSLVVSLWENWFKKGDAPGTLTYSDKLSRWKGNEPGRNEFRRHLEQAQEGGATLRIVLAHPDPSQAYQVGNVADESNIKKTFSVRSDWIGSVDFFDGDEYRLLIRHTRGISALNRSPN